MRNVIRSKRVYTGASIEPADIIIEYDQIIDLQPYGSYSTCVDLGNGLVTPGFIDLHSDSVEKEIEPRPGAEFPVENALVDLDKKLAMAGITTMFHAIAFNDESLVGRRGTQLADELIRNITKCNRSQLLIDNLVHARYEITSFGSLKVIKELIESYQIQMLSFMDHSPGQGQFKSLEKWKQYHIPVYELSENDVNKIVTGKLEKKSSCMRYLQELTHFAKERNILLASHDDDSPDKVALMRSLGISIAEFPINLETAQQAHVYNMATGMGAPNVVRGKSQSGNISARELLDYGCCDFLCSDYHPTSLLQAVYIIHQEMGQDLVTALSYITSTPAKIAKLHDRGEISPGKLADMVVIDDYQVPTITLTFKSGVPVYNSNSCLCMPKAA